MILFLILYIFRWYGGQNLSRARLKHLQRSTSKRKQDWQSACKIWGNKDLTHFPTITGDPYKLSGSFYQNHKQAPPPPWKKFSAHFRTFPTKKENWTLKLESLITPEILISQKISLILKLFRLKRSTKKVLVNFLWNRYLKSWNFGFGLG